MNRRKITAGAMRRVGNRQPAKMTAFNKFPKPRYGGPKGGRKARAMPKGERDYLY